MKLVSDFDGVWTDPAAEAAAQGEILEGLLVEALPAPLRERGHAWVRAARAAVAADPWRHGWASRDRISAFGDEDPFTAHSSLARFVEEADGDPIATAIRDGLAAAGKSVERLGSESHRAAVARVQSTAGPRLAAGAGEAGRALLDAGVEVVVVSNSPPEKLGAWFAAAGLRGVTHPERAPGALRFRGGARKFELDREARHPLALGDRTIETARPVYEGVLDEERPDAVVGDVFSLDLALPLRLRRERPEWRGLRVLWQIQPYTPGALRERVARHAGGEVEEIVGGVPALARALLGR